MNQSYFPAEGRNETTFNTGPDNMAIADSFNGLQRKNARMWQLIALISLSSFFIALGLMFYAINLPKTVPVIVTVDGEGRQHYAGKVDGSYKGRNATPDIARSYQIKRLITSMHTLHLDKDAQKSLVREAQSIVQAGAISQLDLFFQAHNPFMEIGSKTRSVEIDPPLKETAKTWVVYFTTTERSLAGYEGKKTRYSALVNIDDNYEASEANPLGLYITNFDLKETEVQA
jgi:type IV secretion system protein VirB5